MRDAAKRMLSDQRAKLANTGFSATDNTAAAVTSDTVQTSTLEEELARVQADERANAMDYAAKVGRWEGKNAKRASYVQAGATLLQGLSNAGGMRAPGGVSTPSYAAPSGLIGPR